MTGKDYVKDACCEGCAEKKPFDTKAYRNRIRKLDDGKLYPSFYEPNGRE